MLVIEVCQNGLKPLNQTGTQLSVGHPIQCSQRFLDSPYVGSRVLYSGAGLSLCPFQGGGRYRSRYSACLCSPFGTLGNLILVCSCQLQSNGADVSFFPAHSDNFGDCLNVEALEMAIEGFRHSPNELPALRIPFARADGDVLWRGKFE